MYVIGDNCWRDYWEWPLARTQWMSYHLHSGGRANTLYGDGSLSAPAPGGEATDGFVCDPADTNRPSRLILPDIPRRAA
jgi:uncharacterized protein